MTTLEQERRPRIKRFVVGRPKSTGELEETLLPKRLALPIFASDALSSTAYATQEILAILALVPAIISDAERRATRRMQFIVAVTTIVVIAAGSGLAWKLRLQDWLR